MTGAELTRRLERDGESRTRQGVHFVLLQLEREGKVERVAASNPTRWQVLQLRLQPSLPGAPLLDLNADDSGYKFADPLPDDGIGEIGGAI